MYTALAGILKQACFEEKKKDKKNKRQAINIDHLGGIYQ
jgi:hypothetical protein